MALLMTPILLAEGRSFFVEERRLYTWKNGWLSQQAAV